MKHILALFILIFLCIPLEAQVFEQILPLDQIIHNDKAYVVTIKGDTLSGRITRIRGGGKNNRVLIQEGDDGFYRFTIKNDVSSAEFGLDEIKMLAIVPTLGMAKFTQTNLGGDLQELNRLRKDPYIRSLMKGDSLFKLEPPSQRQEHWVIYEAVKLAHNQIKGSDSPDFELRQLLNPTFDSRIKVYPDTPGMEAENTNETKVFGLKIASNNPGSYLISIEGKPIQRIQQFGHKRNAKKKIFRNCSIIPKKPKWKDFALNVFKDHMECGDRNK